jgi:hypothetical protein
MDMCLRMAKVIHKPLLINRWKMSNKTEILPSQKLEVPPTEYVFKKACLSPASRGEQVKINL